MASAAEGFSSSSSSDVQATTTTRTHAAADAPVTIRSGSNHAIPHASHPPPSSAAPLPFSSPDTLQLPPSVYLTPFPAATSYPRTTPTATSTTTGANGLTTPLPAAAAANGKPVSVHLDIPPPQFLSPMQLLFQDQEEEMRKSHERHNQQQSHSPRTTKKDLYHTPARTTNGHRDTTSSTPPGGGNPGTGGTITRARSSTRELLPGEAEKLSREAEKAAERYAAAGDEDDEREYYSVGTKLLALASAILAIMICVGGSVMLYRNREALTTKFQCDQLFVWGLLFVIFEGLYLLGLTIHACFSGESYHTKRVKSLILLVVFIMSVLFFIWGTIIINTSECPETTYAALWLVFRLLYWFIIGVWSVVLLILTAPLVLFLVVKTWMNRTQ